MNKSFVFMAIAKGKETVESAPIKRYVGVAPVKVLAVNPTKAELEGFYNTTLENEPEYLSEVEVGEDRHKVKSVRFDFIVQTDAEKCYVDTITKHTYYLKKEYRFNRDRTKVQVIDKYGRTAWVTIEQAKAKEIPMYKNGPANLDADYRPCYIGEEELTSFIKAYLNIPNVMKYVNGSWVMNEMPEECEVRCDEIEKYFTGDISEIKAAVKYMPNNKVKILFGVKTTDEGKQYQATYTQMVLKNGVRDYTKLKEDLQERKAAGAYPNTEFEVCDIKEYTVEATTFNNDAPNDLPFSNNTPEWSF